MTPNYSSDKQRGSLLIVALGSLLVVGTVAAGLNALIVQDAGTSADTIEAMRNTSINDSVCLFAEDRLKEEKSDGTLEPDKLLNDDGLLYINGALNSDGESYDEGLLKSNGNLNEDRLVKADGKINEDQLRRRDPSCAEVKDTFSDLGKLSNLIDLLEDRDDDADPPKSFMSSSTRGSLSDIKSAEIELLRPDSSSGPTTLNKIRADVEEVLYE